MGSDYAVWLIGWAYVLVNAGRVLSYLPQIVAVWRCSDGARSISLLTWSYWACSHLTASLYAGIGALVGGLWGEPACLWLALAGFVLQAMIIILASSMNGLQRLPALRSG